MTMKSRLLVYFSILLLGLVPVCDVNAQETEIEDTHAHSSSLKWKGIDVDDVIGENSPYAPNPGSYTDYSPFINKYPFDKGKTIFLYNVGTGKFIIEGGNYGMEGRLFHETFGRPLYLFSDGFILSGIKENNNEKFLFGCNVPSVFHKNTSWNNWGTYSFTIMMDADISKRDYEGAGWHFDPVSTDDGTHTYYMYEEKNGKQYYLGAAYGECHATAWKGNGTLVFMDDDRATWTTANPRHVEDKYEVNGEMITLDELYQWRLVDEDEFRSMLDNEDIGLNPSVSIFITDRDFTRNSQVFNNSWFVENKTGADYSVKHRLGYTYGSSGNTSTKQNQYNTGKAWNEPIRLKHVFDGKNSNNQEDVVYDDNNPNVKVKYGWKNAKYGFLTFEGVGRTYTEVEVPRPGWYLVQCYGFVQSDEDHDAYIFAKVKGSDETSPTGGEARNNLKKVPAGTFTGKDVKDNCLVVGKELTKNGENYKNAVWICVTEEQFESDDPEMRTLQIGVGKDEATQSNPGVNNGGRTYYYDTDWVCVDDFRMSYLGLRPAFFYEDEENLNYLKPEQDVNKQYQGASPTGQYAGAICIERSLLPNQWNTFSFPLKLTGEQIRQAFGEDAELAYIHSVGGLSQHDNVIDFKTKTLFTPDPVVEPGQFYLLKPTKLPLNGIDPRGKEVEYYELGRKYFSVNDEPDSYTHDLLAVGTKMENTETIKLDDVRQGTASVTYVQTSDIANFHVNSDGIYTGTNIYAPKGSYAVSVKSDKATIFHLKRATPIKGFRGWINLDNELDQQSSKEFSMEIYGMFFKEPSGVTTGAELPRIQILSNDEAVYDLTGRKVGTIGKNLPKGMYIVKGKKFFVK